MKIPFIFLDRALRGYSKQVQGGLGPSLVAHLACVGRLGISSSTVFTIPSTWIVWGFVGATGSGCSSLSPSTSSLTGASHALWTCRPATSPIRVYIWQPILQCSDQVLKVIPCYTVTTENGQENHITKWNTNESKKIIITWLVWDMEECPAPEKIYPGNRRYMVLTE